MISTHRYLMLRRQSVCRNLTCFFLMCGKSSWVVFVVNGRRLICLSLCASHPHPHKTKIHKHTRSKSPPPSKCMYSLSHSSPPHVHTAAGYVCSCGSLSHQQPTTGSWVLSSWQTSLSLPANAAWKTGSNAEKWGVPGRREGGGPAWPNLGLDVRTFGSHLGPWVGPHVWVMKPCCWWSHPLQKEQEGEKNTQISWRVSLFMLMAATVG